MTNGVAAEFYFSETVDMVYPMDAEGNYKPVDEGGVETPIFKYSNKADGTFTPNVTWTRNVDDEGKVTFTQTFDAETIADMIQLNEAFFLDVKSEYDAFDSCLTGSIRLLLTDGTGESDTHRGIGISAKEYVKKSTKGWMNVTVTVVTCVFSASIAFFANAGASWGLVMYTVLKLALLCWRMYKGYSAGAKAYNTIEVKHLQDKMTYMHLYLEHKNTIPQS